MVSSFNRFSVLDAAGSENHSDTAVNQTQCPSPAKNNPAASQPSTAGSNKAAANQSNTVHSTNFSVLDFAASLKANEIIGEPLDLYPQDNANAEVCTTNEQSPFDPGRVLPSWNRFSSSESLQRILDKDYGIADIQKKRILDALTGESQAVRAEDQEEWVDGEWEFFNDKCLELGLDPDYCVEDVYDDDSESAQFMAQLAKTGKFFDPGCFAGSLFSFAGFFGGLLVVSVWRSDFLFRLNHIGPAPPSPFRWSRSRDSGPGVLSRLNLMSGVGFLLLSDIFVCWLGIFVYNGAKLAAVFMVWVCFQLQPRGLLMLRVFVKVCAVFFRIYSAQFHSCPVQLSVGEDACCSRPSFPFVWFRIMQPSYRSLSKSNEVVMVENDGPDFCKLKCRVVGIIFVAQMCRLVCLSTHCLSYCMRPISGSFVLSCCYMGWGLLVYEGPCVMGLVHSVAHLLKCVKLSSGHVGPCCSPVASVWKAQLWVLHPFVTKAHSYWVFDFIMARLDFCISSDVRVMLEKICLLLDCKNVVGNVCFRNLGVDLRSLFRCVVC
ncbi:hypothetical protein Hanom_Chr15g01337481 [Helianthus anomalus]